MNIINALEPTEKVQADWDKTCYAMKDNTGILSWYSRKGNSFKGVVPLPEILRDGWSPYHEVKEIRPEKAGELWATGDVNYMTQKIGDELRMIPRSYDMQILEEIDHFVHRVGCYKRLYPPVEEDSVERIEANISFSEYKPDELSSVICVNGPVPNCDRIVDFLLKSNNGRLFLEIRK